MLGDRLTAAVVLARLAQGSQLFLCQMPVGSASRIRGAAYWRLSLFVKDADIKQEPFPRLTAQAGMAPNGVEFSCHGKDKNWEND